MKFQGTCNIVSPAKKGKFYCDVLWWYIWHYLTFSRHQQQGCQGCQQSSLRLWWRRRVDGLVVQVLCLSWQNDLSRFLVFVTRKIFKMLKLFRYFNFLFRVHQKILFYLKYQFMICKMVLAAKSVSRLSL